LHGAGAQRSDPKEGMEADYPQYHGPQGDLQMVFNHCRCVRSIPDETTGIDNTEELEIMVFPNPTKDILNISFLGEKPFSSSVKIYDVYGKLVFSEFFAQADFSIDLSSISEGVYYLVLESGQAKKTLRKIIKT